MNALSNQLEVMKTQPVDMADVCIMAKSRSRGTWYMNDDDDDYETYEGLAELVIPHIATQFQASEWTESPGGVFGNGIHDSECKDFCGDLSVKSIAVFILLGPSPSYIVSYLMDD